ncbi:MAG: S9 family peptidase [Gemmataceae bacterium]|nr:S9 family peptidase [Gemmataceae bacterium]
MKSLSISCLALFFSMTFAHAQTGVITPGDNLVTLNIPKIPASIAEDVGRYTEFRSAGLASWHPTKREMLISTRFADTSQIHHVKFPGGARTQLTFFPDSVIGGSYQPKKGEFFLFAKGTGGNERFQIYRQDFSTGNVTLLTDGKSRNSGGIWSNAGDRIVYTSTKRNGADNDIYLMNPADPAFNKLLLEVKGGGWFPAGWSPNDAQVIVGEYVSINETYIWLVDAKKGEKTLVTPKGPEKIAYLGGAFAPDGKGLYVTTDKDSEFQRLALLDLATKKHTYLSDHIKWDIESIDLARDGKTIAFIANENGIGTLHLLDTATGKERPTPKLPAGSVLGVSWHENSKDLGFVLTSARSPTDVYSLNIDNGQVERWTQSETGGLNTGNFVEPELVRWKSFDKREISGFLYKPSAKFTGKRPVIINIHGGPEAQFRPTFLGRNNYYLNELGVAMIFPNIRGSSGYGKTFLTLDNGFLREDSYKDIESLLDWIATRPDLDADRILVTGGSYGGHMTLAVVTYYPERIRCAVDVVGMSNLVSFLENTESYRRDLRRAEYGDERDPKMRKFMETIAPLNNAQKIKKPLFIVQGKNDPRVPLIESEQMLATLKKQGTPVWYLMAEDEGHGFAKKKNADFQFYASVMFVREFLLK